MDGHQEAVASIARAVEGFYREKQSYRIFHGSTNSTRPRPGAEANVVDISALRHVVEIDRDGRTALVEPNVPMDKLVEATLRHGLVPPVVMEFPGITAGGGYAGTAGESSSFRHGFFNDTINWVEMVLGNGEVVRASRDERADLFCGAAGAVGTLGIVTLIELRLMDAAKFVRLTYHRTDSVAAAIEKVAAETSNPANDYVDAILFSRHHGVVITGTLTDKPPPDGVPVQTFSGAFDPWFFMHVQERTAGATSSDVVVDHVPLAEYLFRYDRAGFWVGIGGWKYFNLPFNRWTRWLLDDLMHTRVMYRALHASGESARFVLQDLALPYAKAEELIDYAVDKFAIWPLWLCPLKQTPPPTFHPYTGETETDERSRLPVPKDMLSIGLWGWGPADPAEFVRQNRALEDKLLQLGGRKWLYAHTYYDQDQFWHRVYPENRDWYHALRAKYHATTLPTVHDKVYIDVDAHRHRATWRQSAKRIWPLGGVYGLWRAFMSHDFLLHRTAEWKYQEPK